MRQRLPSDPSIQPAAPAKRRPRALAATALAAALLAGCGGDGERVDVRVIGQVEGPLAAEAGGALNPVAGDVRTPIVVGEGQLGQADRAAITAAYQAGTPVALVNATVDEVNLLRATVGLPTGAAFPAGVAVADVYALDQGTRGRRYELAVYAPQKPAWAHAQAPGSPEGQFTEVPVQEGWADTPQQQAQRMRVLLQWLQDNQARDDAPLPPEMLPQAQAGGAREQPREEKTPTTSVEGEVVYQMRGNVYRVKMFTIVMRLETQPDSLFMRGVIEVNVDGRGAIVVNDDSARGRMVSGLRVAAVPAGDLGWSSQIRLSSLISHLQPADLGRASERLEPYIEPLRQSMPDGKGPGWMVDYYLPQVREDLETPDITCSVDSMWPSNYGTSRASFMWSWTVEDKALRASLPSGLPVNLKFEALLRATRAALVDSYFCDPAYEDESSGVTVQPFVIPWPSF